MINRINSCFQNTKIASYFCDQGDTQIHLVGYVQMFNDSEVLIAHVSQHGCYDGFILKQLEDIRRIDYDGEYERKIEALYQLKKQTHSNIFNDDPNTELLYSLLDFAIQNNHVVSLELANECISGFVKKYNNDIICISVLDDFGRDNGISSIYISEILTFAVDTDDEQDLKMLHSTQGAVQAQGTEVCD